MIVVWLFLTIPRVYLQFVIVVFPDYTEKLLLDARSVKKLTISKT